MVNRFTVKVLPSASVSLLSTPLAALTLSAVSSGVLLVSGLATGIPFTVRIAAAEVIVPQT